MNYWFGFGIGLLFMACTSANVYTIEGKFPEDTKVDEVFLLSRLGKGGDTLARAQVKPDRTFLLQGEVISIPAYFVAGRRGEPLLFYAEPGKYTLKQEKQRMYLLPEEVQAKQMKINEFRKLLHENSEAMQKLQSQGDFSDEEKAAENERLWRQRQDLVIGILQDFKGSEMAVALAAENMWIAEYDFKFFTRLVEAVGEGTVSSQWQKIMEKFRAKEALQLRGMAPAFQLPDQHGKKVRLADYKGKYLLLDFWASWCKPCRAKSKQLKKMYPHFQETGIEIVAISCDKNKSQWLKAIEEDQPLWDQLLADSQMNGSDVLKDYKVNVFPTLYLLSPEGEVLATNPDFEEIFRIVSTKN